jgi:hypothetical protein
MTLPCRGLNLSLPNSFDLEIVESVESVEFLVHPFGVPKGDAILCHGVETGLPHQSYIASVCGLQSPRQKGRHGVAANYTKCHQLGCHDVEGRKNWHQCINTSMMAGDAGSEMLVPQMASGVSVLVSVRDVPESMRSLGGEGAMLTTMATERSDYFVAGTLRGKA